ncbi:hypothetical protein [Klebsiella pneumoniae]|uniref:hypothetical protein n=1 Tax=Klebsiella pneumoniae TaxID=573 RepID=UPI00132FE548|nr:hypothetical protein [Klebsiella pneumoniae]
MVEILQRYDLSATAGAASLILSADNVGLPVHRGAKPDSLTTHHFAEKKFLHQKIREVENRAAFSPIFRHMGCVLEGAMMVVIVIQIATANAAKGF